MLRKQPRAYVYTQERQQQSIDLISIIGQSDTTQTIHSGRIDELNSRQQQKYSSRNVTLSPIHEKKNRSKCIKPMKLLDEFF